METPPRMWGRLERAEQTFLKNRNTPTHVGKTDLSKLKAAVLRKHPHACGEDECAIATLERLLETPPRMWGRPY